MSAALPWHPRHLLLAPHRLGFFLAIVLLWTAGLWWALVQLDRVTGALWAWPTCYRPRWCMVRS